MRRREFITILSGAAAMWPIAARAQQAAMPVVGSLFSVSAAAWADNMVGFRKGLDEAGVVVAVTSLSNIDGRMVSSIGCSLWRAISSAATSLSF